MGRAPDLRKRAVRLDAPTTVKTLRVDFRLSTRRPPPLSTWGACLEQVAGVRPGHGRCASWSLAWTLPPGTGRRQGTPLPYRRARFSHRDWRLDTPSKAVLHSVASQTKIFPARLPSGGIHKNALKYWEPARTKGWGLAAGLICWRASTRTDPLIDAGTCRWGRCGCRLNVFTPRKT